MKDLGLDSGRCIQHSNQLLIEFTRFVSYSGASYARQSFLLEGLLDDHDSGSLRATALLLERSAHESVFLR